VKHTSRVYGLDVYRAVAILLVVMSHGALIAPELVPPFPMIDGVELFFVLSGFLIGTILIRTLEKEESFGFRSILHFWKRRWFRTLPNYYLILLVNILLVSKGVIGGADAMDQFNWKFFVFCQNLASGYYGFFWESWSLSVEEWFYIVLPLVVVLLRSFLSKKDTLLFTIAILIAAPLAYRISQGNEQVDKFWYDVEFRKVVIMRLDTIIYGVLAAYIKYYYVDFWKRSRWIAFVAGIVIIYTAILIPKEPNDLFSKTFFFSMVSIGAMMLLPLADSVKNYRTKIIGKTLTHISLISYSMYLINFALVAQVIVKNFPPKNEMEQVVWYFIFWGITIVLSTVLYYFFEKPMMKLRDRF
jgi:peptidoglycan/LPS O-acetylase OafA/YrhL